MDESLTRRTKLLFVTNELSRFFFFLLPDGVTYFPLILLFLPTVSRVLVTGALAVETDKV